MTGDRLQQAADTRNQATVAARRSLTVQGTIVAVTEPAAGRARDPIVDLRIRTLTRCERELLGLLAKGWSNRRIADECLLSLHTVRTRVQNVLVKLGVHSKLEAVAFAFEHDLVAPERIGRPSTDAPISRSADQAIARSDHPARPHHSPRGHGCGVSKAALRNWRGGRTS